MQRNGAAPVLFLFLFLFLVSFFFLTEFIHNPCSAPARCTVDLIRRAVAQRLVRSFRVVKHKVFCQPHQQFRHRGVAFQIHVFVFDAAPEPFHKDVVQVPGHARPC